MHSIEMLASIGTRLALIGATALACSSGSGPAPVDPEPSRPTAPAPPAEPSPVVPQTGASLWITPAELAGLPVSGAAWTSLKQAADRGCGTVRLSNQDSDANVCVMAKALVFARTGEEGYRDAVVAALRTIAESGEYRGRALALGRELAAYVIAADLVGLAAFDAALDQRFRAKLAELRTTRTNSGPDNLVACHEQRPNNWGTMCGASRAAIAAYLRDEAELERTARVFRGYLGDRAAYAGFEYDSDLSWQCDPAHPVGINPKGCTKDGLSLDGVMPDDQRRGGRFRGVAVKEGYVYEGLQGALAQALLLSRQGYDVWSWSDRALLRAFTWAHEVARFPAEGDDTWQPHLVNRAYGASFPAPVPAATGKVAGWTDWTHGPKR